MKIRFSAGHGAGSEYNRGGLFFNEGDENLNFTDLLLEKLKKYDGDFKEIRREKGNYDHDLDVRSKYGSGADLFYSSHSNAASSSASGVEVILSYQSINYINFAEKLCKLISEILGINNRGVKFRDWDSENWEVKSQARSDKKNWFGELNGNKAKCAMIVEHFFHTNKDDSNKYLKNKDRLATEITRLIANEFGLKEKGNGNSITANKVTGKYTLLKAVNVYKTSGDAKNSTNKSGIYQAGVYTIYKEFNGMLNISKKAGVPGAWINPKDNFVSSKKSNDTIAREVIEGLWGNGEDRKNRLKNAGYDYNAVQNEVNKLV